MRCNICGGIEFSDMPKRPRVRCTACGSLERTRVAALLIDRKVRPPAGARILHAAPERGLADKLRAIGGSGYRAIDIDPDRYPGLEVERFDLCRDVFGLVPKSFDLIVHNHVLEHIECNYTAVLLRLAKALKPAGTMLFSVPILPGDFTDEIVDAPIDAKLARFGESLHVRRFGDRVLQQTLGMVFTIPDRYDLLASFTADELIDINIPRHHWQRFTGASIFAVQPPDVKV